MAAPAASAWRRSRSRGPRGAHHRHRGLEGEARLARARLGVRPRVRFALDRVRRRRPRNHRRRASMSCSTASPARRWSAASPACSRSAASSSSANAIMSATRTSGLRPFRKNLSYFGVDLDQLMRGSGGCRPESLRELMRRFESGTFAPLPYSVFARPRSREAFHLMQHSGHIGKIVVAAAGTRTVRDAPHAAFAVDPGRHASDHRRRSAGSAWRPPKWLVERGARHLVLLGRRGRDAESAKRCRATSPPRRRGLSPSRAMSPTGGRWTTLFENIGATMPPMARRHARGDGARRRADRESRRGALPPRARAQGKRRRQSRSR